MQFRGGVFFEICEQQDFFQENPLLLLSELKKHTLGKADIFFVVVCIDNHLRTHLGNLGFVFNVWPKPFVLRKVQTSVVLNP